MAWKKALFVSFACAVCAYPQATVTGLKIHADPSAEVRPLESIALQIRIYGRVGDTEGRIRRARAEIALVDEQGGWISKPFRFQGRDDEEFVDQFQSPAGQILGQIAGQFVLQDAVLYTAPERAGSYRVKAELDGVENTLTIEVNPRAPSLRPAEEQNFAAERRPADPYRPLVEHWSPLLAQETWWTPKADYIARFDYDGDWQGDNNWTNLDAGASQAYVHYAVMETETHWFLIYNVFHPRDYSDKCVAGSCHENDNEGLILTVLKDGSPHGRLQAMETLAHNNIYSFTADDRVRGGVHNIEGPVEFHEDHHPVVFIESGGHGIYGTRSSHARYDVANDRFTASTGVTYVYRGHAERPRHPNDRLVGYELLPIYEEWWRRMEDGSGGAARIFDDFFWYEPLGGRPGTSMNSIGGAFYGRERGRNLAKPFWGWHDNRTKKRDVLAVGQWGLDPAYSAAKNLQFPEPFSLIYVHNPYLALGGSGAGSVSRTPPPPAPSRPSIERGRGGYERSIPAGEPESGVFEFRVQIDGTVGAMIHGDFLSFLVESGSMDVLADFPSNQTPIPKAPLADLRVDVREGRGAVQIVEWPAPENGYGVVLRMEDPQAGSGRYEVRLEWRR